MLMRIPALVVLVLGYLYISGGGPTCTCSNPPLWIHLANLSVVVFYIWAMYENLLKNRPMHGIGALFGAIITPIYWSMVVFDDRELLACRGRANVLFGFSAMFFLFAWNAWSDFKQFFSDEEKSHF